MANQSTLYAESIDKLRSLGKDVRPDVTGQALASAICEAMSWAPRRDYEAVIARFSSHELGSIAGSRRAVREARPLVMSPEMEEAVSRSRPMSFMSLSGGKS